MPAISVIVPVFKVEEYLCRCIDSILAQTFTDFELILVDDGSPDNCGAICDDYAAKDSRIRVVHKENGGVSRARNTGIECSTGEYIAFVDSDDYIRVDYLETMYNRMVSNDYDCVSIGYAIVDLDNIEIKKGVHPALEYVLNSEYDVYEHIVSVLRGKTGWELWTRLFRADIIRVNNIRLCETCENFAEDLGFYLSYLLYCKRICNIDYIGYYYTHRVNSMMRKSENDVRLNPMNEISKYYFNRVETSGNKELLDNYSKIHSLIIYNQLIKVVKKKLYSDVPRYCNLIQNKKWYNKQTMLFVHNKTYISECIEKKDIALYRNLCFYTIHKNYFVFRFIRYISKKRKWLLWLFDNAE